MATTSEILTKLIEEGDEFTYKNFCSSWSRHGYPASLSTEWVSWTSRVEAFTKSRFGADSVPFAKVKQGLEIGLLGNGESPFQTAKGMILGALQGALDGLADETIREGGLEGHPGGPNYSNRVFIVHGHDDKSKQELETLVQEIGLEPVVLHRQPDEGQTIIEKFEKHSDVGFVFVLLTPDDIAYSSQEDELDDEARRKEKRARPNVIFEFGYFVGKLGRRRVCCLHKGGVTLPSDVSGLLYKPFQQSIQECAYAILKELKAAGYQITV